LTVGGAEILVILLIFICGRSARNKKSCPIVSYDCRLKIDKLGLCSLVAELLRWSDIDFVREGRLLTNCPESIHVLQDLCNTDRRQQVSRGEGVEQLLARFLLGPP
jgi:hypothetical protein